MAIAQAMSTLFKKDVLLGDHHLDSDNIYVALYTSSATLNATTDGYITANEVANGNGYTTGGVALASKAVTENSTSGVFDADDPQWTSATFTARGALIYLANGGTNPAVAVLDFGSDKTSTAGDFTIVFPAADASNAIIRIA